MKQLLLFFVALSIVPLTAHAQSCEPYVCANGTTFAACSADGHPIMYFVEPCQFNGGHVQDSSQSAMSSMSVFSDVHITDPYYDAIVWAKMHNIIEGYGYNIFKPNALINRAEFIKIMMESLATRPDGCTPDMNRQLFKDIPLASWYEPYVCQAKLLHMIDGYLDGTFKPDVYINAAEAAKIIVKQHSQNTIQQNNFGIWYEPFIFYLKNRSAFPITITSASYYITRAEMVEIMYRLAWSDQPSTSSNSSISNQNNDLLLEAKNTGGLCMYGGCMTSYTFKKDGSVVINSNNSQRTVQLPAVQLSALNLFLQNTDVIEIMKHPFTGTCPRAYDGSAYIYTLYQNGIVTTIDACDYVTDDAIFALVEELINSMQQ